MTLLLPTYIILGLILILIIAIPVWNKAFGAVHAMTATVIIVMLVVLTVMRNINTLPLPSLTDQGLDWSGRIELDWNQEAKFRRLFRLISTPAYIVNMDRRIQHVNTPAMELFLKELGLDYEQVEGKKDIPEIMQLLIEKGILLNANELKHELAIGLRQKSTSQKYKVMIRHGDQTITFMVLALPISVGGELQGRFISMIPIRFENDRGEIITPKIYSDEIIRILEILSTPT